MPTVKIYGWRLDQVIVESDDGGPGLNKTFNIDHQDNISLEFNEGTIIEVELDDVPIPPADTWLITLTLDTLGSTSAFSITHPATTGWEYTGGEYVDDPFAPHYVDEGTLSGPDLESVELRV